jgi:hypothetical protein
MEMTDVMQRHSLGEQFVGGVVSNFRIENGLSHICNLIKFISINIVGVLGFWGFGVLGVGEAVWLMGR